MGKGDKLTELARLGDNPYRDVVFKTAWDKMAAEPDDLAECAGPSSEQEQGSPKLKNPLFAEWREDEHAARVRDYGEADAATFEARRAEAVRLSEQAATPPRYDPAEYARPPSKQEKDNGKER